MPIKSERKRKADVASDLIASRPLTRQEMHEAARQRISHIAKEFKDGFEFLEDYPRSVTFFGSSRLISDHPYYQKTVSLSKKLVNELGYTVVTGGGPGIMEAANRGAFEGQGSSVGITIKLPHEQATNGYLTDKIPLYYFFTRKVCLTFSAEAYVFLPGGFGTLDELFELLTLVQTRKIEPVPIILFGSEFWKPLEEFLKNGPLARGMIDDEDLNLYTIQDSEDAVVEIIKKAPIRLGLKYKNHNE